MDTYNSIIFGNFLQPITCCVFYLVRTPRESVPEKTNEVDSDWVLSGILLTVVILECALRYTHVHHFPEDDSDGLSFYERIRSARPSLPDVREVFVLRNAIAHG